MKWYFYCSFFVLFIFGIFLFFWQRMVSAKKLTNQRLDIARALHDDLGVILTAIRMKIESVISHQPVDSTMFLEIYELSKKASMSIYESLWIIDSRNDTMEELAEKFEEINNMVLVQMNANVQYVDELDRQVRVSPLLRQQLFYIYEESINNIVKHSYAKNIYIKVWSMDSHFSMEFRNDNLGRYNKVSRGWGLSNIEKRAHSIDAKVISKVENGIFILTIKS